MNERDTREMIRLMARLGPPKAHLKVVTEDYLTTARCACNKVVPIGVLKTFNTGVITALDNVCPGCEHVDKGLARIVCCTCKTVVARLAPHKDKVGFEYKAGRSYHTETCGYCDPKIGQTSIIEKLLFDQKVGRKRP